MYYPNKETTIALLQAAAERAARDITARHPGDIATAMALAIETAGDVILDSYKQFYKSQDSD